MSKASDKTEQTTRTKAQRAFMREYKDNTLFEFQDDTAIDFRERAQDQILWFRNYAEDAAQRLERELAKVAPRDWDAEVAR